MILDKIEPITIFSAKIASKKDLYIENDLILFDEVNELPLPAESRKMGCILLALCLKGHAEYIVDTDKLIVHPNDLMIINEGQLTEDYKLSEDFKELYQSMIVYDPEKDHHLKKYLKVIG